MAFWGSETLKKQIPALRIVEPYDADAVKHAAYELRMGPDVFRTASDDEKKQTLREGESFVIPPGQFALLVTRETVTIPNTAVGLISIKSGVKVRGLVNVSGFHVDPGFSGMLHFAVYNAGSQNLVLNEGDRLFCLWLCALDTPTTDTYNGRHNHQKGLSADEVMMIQGDVASPAALKKQLDEFKNETDRKMAVLDTQLAFWRGASIAVLFIIIAAIAKPTADWLFSGKTNGSAATPTTSTPPASVPSISPSASAVAPSLPPTSATKP